MTTHIDLLWPKISSQNCLEAKKDHFVPKSLTQLLFPVYIKGVVQLNKCCEVLLMGKEEVSWPENLKVLLNILPLSFAYTSHEDMSTVRKEKHKSKICFPPDLYCF